MVRIRIKPDWDRLYEIATAQDGHVSTAQAAEAGYSPQLIAKHLKSGRLQRIRRGIYRIVHYPAGEHEDLAVLWLWSDRAGVFSHETALALLDLSDALPGAAHMTLPLSWKGRRLRIPRGLIRHHADLAADEQTWVGPVPVTNARRALLDCAAGEVAPDLVRDAFEEAVDRGLLDRASAPPVIAYLQRFFPVSRSRSAPARSRRR